MSLIISKAFFLDAYIKPIAKAGLLLFDQLHRNISTIFLIRYKLLLAFITNMMLFFLIFCD